MEGAEAAASLFGSDDSLDPFATLGTEATETKVTQSAEDLFGASDTYAPSEHLDMGFAAPGAVGNVPNNAGHQSTWLDAAQNQQYNSLQSPYSHSSTVNVTEHEPARGSFDEPGQKQGQQPVKSMVATTQSSYSHYAASPRPPLPAYDTPASPSPSTTSAFDPPASSFRPSYSSYTPTTATQYNSTAYASATPTFSSLPPANVPARPTSPTKPIERPKVSNAYDPPFPMTKPRRAMSRGPSVQPHNTFISTSPPPALPPPPTLPPPPRRTTPHSAYSTPAYSHPPPRPSLTPDIGPLTPPTSQSNYVALPDQRGHSNLHHPPQPDAHLGTNGSQQYAPASYDNQLHKNGSTSQPLNFNGGLLEEDVDPEAYAGANGTISQAEGLDWNSSSPFELSHESAAPVAPVLTSSPPPSSSQHSSIRANGSASPHIPYTQTFPTDIDRRDETNGFHAPHRQGQYSNTTSRTSPSSDNIKHPPVAAQSTAVDPYRPGNIHSSFSPAVHGSPVVAGGTPSFSPYLPYSSAGLPRTSSPAVDNSSGEKPPVDLYRPNSSASVARAPSPTRSSSGYDSAYSSGHVFKPPPPSQTYLGTAKQAPLPPPPYLPRGEPLRSRSMSNGSALSSSSADAEDPYAPIRHNRAQTSETDYGSAISRYDYPNHEMPQTLGAPEMKPPTHAPYAPSPSLMGTNDPLGRSSARIPIFSFGFGGKVVSCFHGAATLNTGFDVALSSRNSTAIEIRLLNKIIPESALDISVTFPGPLFSDPGSPTTGLVRTGASNQAKTRKAKVTKYLTDRVEEMNQGIGYLHANSSERQQAAGKLVLVKLLKVMVENDGRLSGSPQIDATVRSALVPQLDQVIGESTSDSTVISGFTPALESTAVASYTGVSVTSVRNEETISTSTLRSSALNKIQDFLLQGERKKAYHYALDEKLWAHAMVIASGIDKDAWEEVVNKFLRTELGVKEDPSRNSLQVRGSEALLPSVNGWEGLRAAYRLYSGQGVSSVQEMIPQNLLSRATGHVSLPLPVLPQMTPMTPNFTVPQVAAGSIPTDCLSKWAETVSMMLSPSINSDTSSALLAFGDHLLANQWVEAAHVCYLLSSQTAAGSTVLPPIGGIGHPTARLILAGSRSPQAWPNFHKDPDPVIFSEIIEFALSLASPTKGQEPFGGLPHLQAYRFIRAATLAEFGYVQLANRYCDAILASVSRPSLYFNETLIEQLKGLSDRIGGVSLADKGGSWMSGKLSKPSLDTIGGWLEGRFTKLVTGDAEATTATEEDPSKVDDRSGNMGPFSQYSSISSAAPSADPSPHSSVVNLPIPPGRTGSAMSTHGYRPPDRAASAMDTIRRKQSPPMPRISSASATTTMFAPSHSFGQALSDYKPLGTMNEVDVATPKPSLDETDDDPNTQEVTWWGDGLSSRTPTATNFVKVTDAAVTSADGFISLMDHTAFALAPPPASTSRPPNNFPDQEGEEEDLGFGNSKSRDYKPVDDKNIESEEKKDQKSTPERPDPRPVAGSGSSGSWFGRWWKRGESSGPVKASLGEETSFYYDKELKRWVNKKAGADAAAKPAPPPPPPSRPATTSPGMYSGMYSGMSASPTDSSMNGRPPIRPASAAESSTAPPNRRAIPRVRSNLVPTPEGDSGPPTPPSARLGPPPPSPMPGRPKSQGSKRPIRNRYVDVFSQDAPPA
ncbi:Sec23-binding domain of Sec16-domain-containing protein [Armillaria borealis]|uniref:Protein transport protein sec16 n=1 Tax=Armillaria borealis TaxID=47425 RepID=A0AA39JXR7_9AGAR|nr:Sec23-binding domain of Sec16-domain-containing protein [Armillaria borealis]